MAASAWVWAIAVGNGALTVLMSLYYRMPLTAPWSTAGAAILVTALSTYSLPQAVGAYMVSALALALLGVSGLFGRLMSLIPQPIVLGMLAGILLRFGLAIFDALPAAPLLVVAMVATFFILRRADFRAPTLGVLLVGMGVAAAQGELKLSGIEVALTRPVFTAPVFSLDAALGLALPLCVLAMTSQYATGQALLRNYQYEAPINGVLVWTGLGSFLLAPFGGHGQTLGALTAAIVTNPDVQPDPTRRYAAAVAGGLWYILFGLFGATIVSLFAGFPSPLVATIAGLALTGAISSSLHGALSFEKTREAALIAFLCTAAEFSLLGVGSAFWGLLAGVLVHQVLSWRKASPS